MSNSKTNGESPYLSMSDFDKRLDFLQRSGIQQVRLIGGEPTLHPQFADMLARAKARDMLILVFSNGIISQQALESLLHYSPEDCIVLVNTNSFRAIEGPTPLLEVRRLEVIKHLGKRALLGYNIYNKEFDPTHLIDIITENDCRKSIRLGLAHPILKAENRFLHPKNYRYAARRIVALAAEAKKHDIRLELDCGFVRCMFSNTDIDILMDANADFGWHCNPILDIDLFGQVIMCFPTSNLDKMELSSHNTATGFRQSMSQRVEPYRKAGIFPECSSCAIKRENQCTGGGMEHTIRRFLHTPFQVRLPSKSMD